MYYAMLHIFIFTWDPTIKSMQSDTQSSYIFTILMMSLMTGGASFRSVYSYFEEKIFLTTKFMSLLCFVGFALIFSEISYKTTLIGFILYEISVGLFFPVYSKIKAIYLPENQRGTLNNMFKVPFNLIVIYLLINTNKIFTIPEFVKLNLVISGALFFITLIFFKERIDKRKLN